MATTVRIARLYADRLSTSSVSPRPVPPISATSQPRTIAKPRNSATKPSGSNLKRSSDHMSALSNAQPSSRADASVPAEVEVGACSAFVRFAIVMEVVVNGVETRRRNVLDNNARTAERRNVIRRFERPTRCSGRGFDRSSFRVYGVTPARANTVLALSSYYLRGGSHPLADSTEEI